MSKQGTKKVLGKWAILEGRLLSVTTQLDRSMKAFHAHPLETGPRNKENFKRGHVYGLLRMAYQHLHDAMREAEVMRCVEKNGKVLENAKSVTEAFNATFPGAR